MAKIPRGKVTISKPVVATMILIVVLGVWFVIDLSLYRDLSEAKFDFYFTSGLLLIPFIQLLVTLQIGSVALGWTFFGLNLSSLVPILVFWYWYSKGKVAALYLFPLFLAITFVLILLALTSALIRPSQTKWKVQLREEMEKHLALSLMFFLGIFLCITYLIGFSFAFHDLELRSRSPNRSVGLYGVSNLDHPLAETLVDVKEYANKDVPKFLFSSGKTGIGIDEQNRYGTEPEVCKDVASERQEAVFRMINNKNALKFVETEIRRLREFGKLSIRINGHTNDKPLDLELGNYGSNYQLSISRASETKSFLIKNLPAELTDSRVVEEWEDRGVANDSSFLGSNPREGLPCHADEWRSVEVLVQPKLTSLGRALTLLDYMYFTIYTITTTGYGDIVPVSSFTKFTTSVANFVEIFFIAVFFNVLLSLTRGPGKEEDNEPARGGTTVNHGPEWTPLLSEFKDAIEIFIREIGRDRRSGLLNVANRAVKRFEEMAVTASEITMELKGRIIQMSSDAADAVRQATAAVQAATEISEEAKSAVDRAESTIATLGKYLKDANRSKGGGSD